MGGRKVLVMGGTGAMGVYLVPELLKKGYQVDVLSLDDVKSEIPNLRYYRGNGKDAGFMREMLRNGYDGIVDFMIYGSEEFRQRHETLLRSTGHYIYLSSYRVYANAQPITEESPQLLDVSRDLEYLASDDYSLFKARGEDILEESGMRNWTAVRPAITYSKFRYQLVTLEAWAVVDRAQKDKAVVLPREARDIQATMTWAGDVAKMFAGLLFNEQALCEHYTLSTGEHNSWGTVAGYYEELLGLKVRWVDRETYLQIVSGSKERYNGAKWQLDYDRLFDRVVDNRKILKIAGLRQEALTPLKEGLRRELSGLPKGFTWEDHGGVNARMDEYLAAHPDNG